jgi:hypothetical protein
MADYTAEEKVTTDAEGAKPTGGKSKLMRSTELARKWSTELKAAQKWMRKFTDTGQRCEKAYLDVGMSGAGESTSYSGKTNLYWSNVQVILSAIYGRLPKAEVERKFDDYDDDVARVAGIMMQRILNSDIEREYDDTNAAMRDAVQDRFIAGLGQVWCRYDVDTEEYDEPVMDPMTGQPQVDPMTGQPVTQKAERITNEEAETDYVHWQDFLYSPARRWREVRWVARRVYMNEARLKKRFKLSADQLAMVPMQARAPTEQDALPDMDVLKATPFKQAAVWEIWEKEGNYACWYVEGCSFVLDDQPDPLELEEFFPCPMPVVATTLTKAFLPRADYAMAQDLYKELDRVNAKLSHLTDAVKAAGVYDKTAGPVKSLLTTSVENALVPVDNWSAFVEKGGMKGVVDWMPIEQFVNAIVQLTQRKNQLQHDLYEVLGISDIMRGASVASETATAQQLKVQYGGARLSNLQNEVARFVSGVMRIRANIVCNVWQPQTIIERSQIMKTPDAPLAQQAVAMLKDFGTAMFSIEVTSDSLAAPDWAAEKEARTEFLGAASNYIMASAPIVQHSPQVGAFLVKLLQWAAAGFKGAKTIEGVLDEAARALEQQAKQPPAPPQPTAEDKKNDAQAAKYHAEADKTAKEAAVMPPLGGAQGIQMTPGGPQPMSPQPAAFGALNGAPGTVAPMTPQMPAPISGAT